MIIKFINLSIDDYEDIQQINNLFEKKNIIINLLTKYIKDNLDDDEFYDMIVSTYSIRFTNEDVNNLDYQHKKTNNKFANYLSNNVYTLKDKNLELYYKVIVLFRKVFNQKRVDNDLKIIKKDYKKQITRLRQKAIDNKKMYEYRLNKCRQIIDRCNCQVRSDQLHSPKIKNKKLDKNN